MTQRISRSVVTIPSGSPLSTEYIIAGHPPTVLEMPVGWTAADICFTYTDPVNDYFICIEDGTPIQIPTGVYHRIILPATYLAFHTSIRIYSGAPFVPVNQAADRVIYLEVWV
jgi:hypothetical protein